jgi:hypothetical protein
MCSGLCNQGMCLVRSDLYYIQFLTFGCHFPLRQRSSFFFTLFLHRQETVYAFYKVWIHVVLSSNELPDNQGKDEDRDPESWRICGGGLPSLEDQYEKVLL